MNCGWMDPEVRRRRRGEGGAEPDWAGVGTSRKVTNVVLSKTGFMTVAAVALTLNNTSQIKHNSSV